VPPATRSYHDGLFATYPELLALIGDPLERPGSGITAERGLRFDDGTRLWIVDSLHPAVSTAAARHREMWALYE
jgi:hypothetical protein